MRALDRVRRSVSLPGLITSFALLCAVSVALAGSFTLTNGDDDWDGSDDPDEVFALAGDDTVRGHEGADTLYGQTDKDLLQGQQDGDHIFGGSGADDLRGNHGHNDIDGEAGQDEVNGTDPNSQNVLRGGDDDDVIDARNGGTDTEIRGGRGEDTCFVDDIFGERQEANQHCEHVRIG